MYHLAALILSLKVSTFSPNQLPQALLKSPLLINSQVETRHKTKSILCLKIFTKLATLKDWYPWKRTLLKTYITLIN